MDGSSSKTSTRQLGTSQLTHQQPSLQRRPRHRWRPPPWPTWSSVLSADQQHQRSQPAVSWTRIGLLLVIGLNLGSNQLGLCSDSRPFPDELPATRSTGGRVVTLKSSDLPLEEEEGALPGATFDEPPQVSTAGLGEGPNQVHASARDHSKLRIVRLFAPEAVQNGTQNVTLDCMFNYDTKLDQRITIKWFFNDELEPIYQWIPELNKRVYSDKYDRFLDKSYEVTDDVDYMLQAYRRLLTDEQHLVGRKSISDLSRATSGRAINSEPADAFGEEPSRRLLARRLNKLAKLGGQHSKQLVDSLRLALKMQQPELSRFRALRLLQPTGELSGRFTCSVSSLDGDDLRSTGLIVYEPAKEFSFSAHRLDPVVWPLETNMGQQQVYNLTCLATGLFPRPTLTLFRYRAGPLSADQRPTSGSSLTRLRPRLAATLLRLEPIEGAQTQLSLVVPLGARASQVNTDTNDIIMPESEPVQPLAYDVVTWALVDEFSLSSKLASQFECQLSIEGTGYERRQGLALQRGWTANSPASLISRSTLVGILTALVSLLCLALAVASSMLIYRMLKRHARNRIHQATPTHSSYSDHHQQVKPAPEQTNMKRSSLSIATVTSTLADSPQAGRMRATLRENRGQLHRALSGQR